MTDDFFSRLPFFLRQYVEGKKWKAFREVQLKSFEILYNTTDHLLISSGTSSGKTEAALFPIIVDLYHNKPKRISTLYISPLIALIDDQKDRVSYMLRDSGIHLYSWHGGISSSTKRKVIDSGEGILQITPESLENIIHRDSKVVKDLFSDLRYVVIDEIHSFMNSDRGLHLLCELETIERISGSRPRRIGLSATLSDYSDAIDWIQSNTRRNVSLVECTDVPDYELNIQYVGIVPKGDPNRQRNLQSFYWTIFKETNDYDCLIFANSRSNVERIATSLKMINEKVNSSKFILVHHSSVSRDYRKYAEELMKSHDRKCTAIATSTLELGIDIGDLERVIQIGTPHTVSSFVQRFGRSGRRNGHPVMICICNSLSSHSRLCGEDIDLVKMIAESELFFKDKWVEPVNYSKKPYSLLFQQTVSYVKSEIIASYNDLVQDVLSLYPFRLITMNDYSLLLQYCIECEVLDYNNHCHNYTLGSRGDYITRHLDYGINFLVAVEFDVYCGKNLIGTVQELPEIGDLIRLAGFSWVVSSIDTKYMRILVNHSDSPARSVWKSGVADVHTKLMRKIYHCLMEECSYDCLDDGSVVVLEEIRKNIRNKGVSNQLGNCCGANRLFPWLGTVQFDTLYRILLWAGLADCEERPFCIILKEGVTASDIDAAIESFRTKHEPIELVEDRDVYSQSLGKYSRYIPSELLKQQFAIDRIDLQFDVWIDDS